MVVQVGLAKFYGSSLPRPWLYEDVKYNAENERIDAPSTPCTPLLSWAKGADWSKGGLSSKRKRMQGKIEGNLKKLRALQDDEEEEEGEAKTAVAIREPEAPNPSAGNDEGLPKKYSDKASPGVRTRAKEVDENVPSSKGLDSGKGGLVRRESLRRSRGKKEVDCERVEPVISLSVESVRRGRRLSGERRGRN